MTNQEKISALLEATPKGLLINGEWRDASDGGTFDVENPATEQTVGHISFGTAADVDKAVIAARGAFESWQFSSREERLELMRSIAAQIEKLLRRRGVRLTGVVQG